MNSNGLKLASGFHRLEAFGHGMRYGLLPFQSIRLAADKHLLTSIGGDYAIILDDDLKNLSAGHLDRSLPIYSDLRARHFIYEGDPSIHLELLAAQYRTKQSLLSEFTALHIFVVTLRCDHSCHYCQVSRVSEDRATFDMSRETAAKAVELMFHSPSKYLKVEFQGGESLLNFDVIRYIVDLVQQRKGDRNVQFVIASNLAFLSDEMVQFCAEHDVKFSCSLDGPRSLHNRNRPRPGADSYDKTIEGIRRVREKLGHDAVAALMTTTADTLERPEMVIDEYVKQGFPSIFLRWISPFGFAVRSEKRIGYDTERFLAFYKRGLEHVIATNLRGTYLREEYAAIILRKILTPYASGYVDLQSPAGLGLSVLVYNYDGGVYASDESRMLAEMGDQKFRLGNVHEQTYEQLFLESTVLETVLDTTVEGIPGCSDCAFSPYCGTDPVYNYATQRDVIGHRPTSSFCRRNMEILRYLFSILEEKSERTRVLKSWVL
jgi:uncharacterized protein